MGRFANVDTRDPDVNITTWFLVVVAAQSVLIRLGTKWWICRRWTSDDYLIIAALAVCIAQSVTISTAVAHGYGDHFSTIPSGEFVKIMKYQYAASILYITSLSLSKLSLSNFIRNLTPVHRDHLLAAVLQSIIAIVGVTGVIGTAFRCDLPAPWDYWRETCFDLRAWAYFLSAANIATDIAIIVQALLLIFGIQATWKKKLMFASVFLSRIFVIIPLIGEIILTHDILNPASTDPTYTSCPAQIASQTVQSMSILTACWGQVKPFLNHLKSNGLRIRGVDYQSSAKGASESRSHGQGLLPRMVWQTETTVEAGPSASASALASAHWWNGDADADADADVNGDSSHSQSYSSRTDIIRETRTWIVLGSAARRADEARTPGQVV
ncbi:hypothetical protein BJX70DRAFT_410292 [Aspergillus crustosus]